MLPNALLALQRSGNLLPKRVPSITITSWGPREDSGLPEQPAYEPSP